MKRFASAAQHAKVTMAFNKMAMLTMPSLRPLPTTPFVHSSNPRRNADMVTANIPDVASELQPRLVK